MTKVAINGFGRIGKMTLRHIIEANLPLDIVAVNDLSGPETAALLFKYDSTYGVFSGEVSHDDENIIINDKKIKVCADRDPLNLPWKELDIDIVLECTGAFRTKETAAQHIEAGAKKVIISAPGKDVDAMFVMGVNEDSYDSESHIVVSNASCTTNCLAPVVKILNESFGIEKGLMNTIHAYTSDQRLIDSPHKDLRRARSATESIIPTKTGAAKAIGEVIPELQGKLDGFAMRVPTPTVSCVDLTFETKKEVTVESINSAIKEASLNEMKGIVGFEEKPLVSIDFRKDNRSAIFDAGLTRVLGNNFAKIVSWYDNEWGYACRLADIAVFISDKK